MNGRTAGTNKAFTLVEVMIVVAIIAMLAAIGTNSVYRARKRSQATKILEAPRTQKCVTQDQQHPAIADQRQ